MNKSLFLKVLALAVVAACSFVATRAAVTVKDENGPGGKMTRVAAKKVNHQAAQNQHTASSGVLKGHKAWAKDGKLFVTAEAAMYDAGTGSRYMWGLTVKNLKNLDDVTVKHYSDEAFTVEAGDTVKKAFSKSFLMPPGSYVVVPTLFQIPGDVADFDLELLKNPNTCEGFKLLSGWQEVTVTD